MRRVWASLVAVWATLAIVAVLAWSRMPSPAQPVTVHGKHGVLVVKSTAKPVTTTHSSPPPP
jgi:hypothetical protein